jgi:hypothetical protein
VQVDEEDMENEVDEEDMKNEVVPVQVDEEDMENEVDEDVEEEALQPGQVQDIRLGPGQTLFYIGRNMSFQNRDIIVLVQDGPYGKETFLMYEGTLWRTSLQMTAAICCTAVWKELFSNLKAQLTVQSVWNPAMSATRSRRTCPAVIMFAFSVCLTYQNVAENVLYAELIWSKIPAYYPP